MRTRKGFTLIELMIVIAIIGILAAIAIPNFRKARQQARQKACQANMRVLQGAVEMFNMDTTDMMSTAVDIALLTAGGYLRDEPKCPESNNNDYVVSAVAGGEADLTKTGVVGCSTHGTVEEPTAL